MNVDQIKKINEMSKILRSHGIAADSQEGTKIAEELAQKIIPQESTPHPSSSNVDVELLLERATRRFQQQIEELKTKIQQLEGQMNHMSSRINQKQAQQQSQPEQSTQNTQEQLQTQTKEKKQEQQNASRSGEYTSDDVSVEKMFYYGNKN